MDILDNFPHIDAFYAEYWNKKAFAVRGAIPKNLFDTLLDGDELAGLACEEDIYSRLVITTPPKNGKSKPAWTCEHGPLAEDRFDTIGDKNWSLLVQNVEQYHTDTASLLQHFSFAPQWLMDDIMVSYSAKGGSVGPHTDSYHVFLVQGTGKRQWKVGNAPITQKQSECIDNADLQILKDSFDGTTLDVSTGDVIYIPPHVAHEGTTLEHAMTFSVGFLGPQLSEMLIAFGAYLEDHPEHNPRYCGQSLSADSCAYKIGGHVLANIQDQMNTALQSPHFTKWIGRYFATPTHDEDADAQRRDPPWIAEEIERFLNDGGALYRPAHIKYTATPLSSSKTVCLSAIGLSIDITEEIFSALSTFLSGKHLKIKDWCTLKEDSKNTDIIAWLYNHRILLRDDAGDLYEDGICE